MNELQRLTRTEQNIRILQEYKRILYDEIFRLNSLTWYEKECLLEQLNYIQPLITKIKSDIVTLKDFEYTKNQLYEPIIQNPSKYSEYSDKNRKKTFASYFDYMHNVCKKT
ncbi:TPA: hypothetical protein QCY85_005605 [Bacillus cereus]|uniref:hypothetical protein n=1 Tax=Bacillus cereus group sp. FL70 TaxID=3040254 RepID=UPI0032FE0F8A|nr:hypothetical protein [Bacillus cereus]HDR8117959.1 hypothetical protein [Bacillus cereus]